MLSLLEELEEDTDSELLDEEDDSLTLLEEELDDTDSLPLLDEDEQLGDDDSL